MRTKNSAALQPAAARGSKAGSRPALAVPCPLKSRQMFSARYGNAGNHLKLQPAAGAGPKNVFDAGTNLRGTEPFLRPLWQRRSVFERCRSGIFPAAACGRGGSAGRYINTDLITIYTFSPGLHFLSHAPPPGVFYLKTVPAFSMPFRPAFPGFIPTLCRGTFPPFSAIFPLALSHLGCPPPPLRALLCPFCVFQRPVCPPILLFSRAAL